MGRSAHKQEIAIKPGHEIHKVDNPMLTEAMSIHGDGVAKIDALHNMRTLLGGFYRFRGTASQNEAAKRFKALVEASQIGQGKALDPAKEAVDGGGIDPEIVFVKGSGARRTLKQLYEVLGKVDYNRAHYVVVQERGPTAYARYRCGNKRPSGPQMARCQRELRQIVDRIAQFFNLAG